MKLKCYSNDDEPFTENNKFKLREGKKMRKKTEKPKKYKKLNNYRHFSILWSAVK